MTRLLNVWPLTCSNKTTEVHTKNLPTKDQSLMETSKKISKAILRKNVTNANVCRIFRLTLYFSDFYLSTDVAWFVFVWQMDPFWWHFLFFLAHKAYCFSRHDVIVLPKRVENINCLIIGDQFNYEVYTFGKQYQGFVFRSKCFWLVIANRNAKDFLWLYYILHHTYINQCTTHTKMKSDMYVTFLFLGET